MDRQYNGGEETKESGGSILFVLSLFPCPEAAVAVVGCPDLTSNISRGPTLQHATIPHNYWMETALKNRGLANERDKGRITAG